MTLKTIQAMQNSSTMPKYCDMEISNPSAVLFVNDEALEYHKNQVNFRGKLFPGPTTRTRLIHEDFDYSRGEEKFKHLKPGSCVEYAPQSWLLAG